MAVSFIGGGNWTTWKKPLNYIHPITVIILTYLISFFKLMSSPGCILNVTLLLFIITSFSRWYC